MLTHILLLNRTNTNLKICGKTSLPNYCWKRRDCKPRFGIVSFREARALARAPRLEVLSVLVAAWPRQKKGESPHRLLLRKRSELIFRRRQLDAYSHTTPQSNKYKSKKYAENSELVAMGESEKKYPQNKNVMLISKHRICGTRWEGREQRKATSGAACAFERKDLCQLSLFRDPWNVPNQTLGLETEFH